MKLRAHWLGAGVLAAALLAGCGGGTENTGSGQPEPPEQTADTSAPTGAENKPNVPAELKFTAQTIDEDRERFNGESLAGRPAVLWFWAEWCPVCQREAPAVAKLADASDDKVEFVGVAGNSDLAEARAFENKYNLDDVENISDDTGEIWQRFGVTKQPAYAFLDANGTLDVVTEPLSEQDLKDRVNQLAKR